MQTIILNGARNGDVKVDEVSAVLSSMLQSFGEVEVFNLREIKIAGCLGCFGCWVKTPGQCVIDDAARNIAKKLAYADLKVYLTPIVFGGYSYELKKVLDRQICNILPFFSKVESGEIHHSLRYDKNGNFVGIGVLPKPDAESETIFKTLVGRNALNMHARAHAAAIVYLTDDSKIVANKIKDALTIGGVKDGIA
jgi:multimeric flavodoxin WrbA